MHTHKDIYNEDSYNEGYMCTPKLAEGRAHRRARECVRVSDGSTCLKTRYLFVPKFFSRYAFGAWRPGAVS